MFGWLAPSVPTAPPRLASGSAEVGERGALSVQTRGFWRFGEQQARSEPGRGGLALSGAAGTRAGGAGKVRVTLGAPTR